MPFDSLVPRSPARDFFPEARENLQSLSHLLVPTSLSSREDGAVSLAAEMASAANAKLTLLHVISKPDLAAPEESAPGWHWLGAIDKLHNRLHPMTAQDAAATARGRAQRMEQARRRMKSSYEELIPSRVRSRLNTRLEIRIGDVVEEVLRLAAEDEVDLVVLTSEVSWLRLPLVPQKLHRLLRQTNKRVVVVRPEVPARARG